MDGYRWDALATYNAERARGLLHSPQWHARMADEQAAFNAERERELVTEGWKEIAPGVWSGPASSWGLRRRRRREV